VPNFEETARKVHEEHAPAWKNAKHGQQWINTLGDYASSIIANRRVDQIDSVDVLKVFSPIWLSKPETARRVRQRVKTVLDWCRANHFRSGENPIEGIAKALPKQPKKRALVLGQGRRSRALGRRLETAVARFTSPNTQLVTI
jgi:hypothetical protein